MKGDIQKSVDLLRHLGMQNKDQAAVLGTSANSINVLASRSTAERGGVWRKTNEDWLRWINVQRVMVQHCREAGIDFHALPIGEWIERLDALERVLNDLGDHQECES